MIRPNSSGLYREVFVPRYGAQDIGCSPEGPQDRFAWESAKILLGEGPDVRTWELISPPSFTVEQDVLGICTGGRFEQIICGKRLLEHATVFQAKAGERIQWGIREKGFRTVLALCPLTPENQHRVGFQRGDFSTVAQWMGKEGTLRVIPGPEAEVVGCLETFLDTLWSTTVDSSDVGVRIKGDDVSLPVDSLQHMVSGPVTDGTVQLTPDGLILFLRSRPTMGGYPRICTVIDADVDVAAQFPPRRRVRFELVRYHEAVHARYQQQEDLDYLRKTMSKRAKEM